MNSVLVKLWTGVLLLAVGAYAGYSVLRARGYFDDPPPKVEEPIKVVELKPGAQPLPELQDVKLIERSGANFRWSQLQGQPWVANVFYTTCQKECSLLAHQIRGLQAEVPDVRFVSITSDPNRDTVEVLKKYADALQADPLRWFFVTGDMREINRASKALFGFALKSPDHAPYLALMDREGRFVEIYDGLSNVSVQQLAIKLKELKDEPKATSDDGVTTVPPTESARTTTATTATEEPKR